MKFIHSFCAFVVLGINHIHCSIFVIICRFYFVHFVLVLLPFYIFIVNTQKS